MKSTKKQQRKGRFLLMGVFVTVLFLVGCQKTQSSQRSIVRDVFAMDTYMKLTAYGDGAEKGLEEAEKEIRRLERIFSVTDSQSEIYRINEQNRVLAENENEHTYELSGEVSEVLKTALDIGEKSNWDFDISLYPVLRAWGFTTGEYRVPDLEEISALKAFTGAEKISLFPSKEGEPAKLVLEEGMEIDFGGIAKGYAADKAINKLKAAGVQSAVFSLGGNIQTLGKKPDGSLWNIAIKDPEKTEQYAGVLQLGECAVVTSGGYERYFEDENGKVWQHILNAKTGYPAESDLLSVTVVGEKGVECDAWSTAFYVKGLDAAIECWRKQEGIELLLITAKNEIYLTEGLAKSFSPLGDYENAQCHVIKR